MSWKGSKLSITADSVTKAEYIAAWEAVLGGSLDEKFIYELGVVPTIEDKYHGTVSTMELSHRLRNQGLTRNPRIF